MTLINRLPDPKCKICKKASALNEHAACHVCKDMQNGEIMPGCIGGAVSGSLEACTCDGSGNPLDIEDRLQKLETKVANLTGIMQDMIEKKQ